MPGIIQDILGAPVTALINGVKTLIGQKLTNDNDKVQAAAQLGALEVALNQAIVAADLEYAKAQRDVLVAEATSDSWLTKSWRPLLMLFFAIVVGFAVFNGGFDLAGRKIPEQFVMEALTIVKLGVGGYIIGRSVEKAAPNVAAALSNLRAGAP